jgi:hypothetical protein
MKIEILPSAMEDLADGRGFYDRQGIGVGDYFLQSLFADIDRCGTWLECIPFISVDITGCWQSGFRMRSITGCPNGPSTFTQYWTVGVIHDGFEID